MKYYFFGRVMPASREYVNVSRRRNGVALIITLSAVVLVTIMIMAFFSKAQINRQISFSGTSQVEVDMLSRSALDIIVGEVREEIRTGSAVSDAGNTAYPSIYECKSAANTILQKSGVSGEVGDSKVTIRKISANETALNSNGGRVLGSAVSSGSASYNGRKWTISRWFTGESSPRLGSANLPDWVLLSRDQGLVVNPSITEAKTSSSAKYVTGRFAYTIYDIGGLLDANVAGYASSLADGSGYKTSAAYADLTALGLSQSQVDTFVLWRNQRTGTNLQTFQEWATGLKRTTGTSDAMSLKAARSGYATVALGDNAILSRHDLINDPNVRTAATYLTHFSRQSNGVAAIPDTVTTSNPKLDDLRFTKDGLITHYNDDGGIVTYSASAGDPLLQRRFSLARLAWLTPEGPSAELPPTHAQYNAGGSAAAIQACFGLVWDKDNSRWTYVGASDFAVQTSIKTLETVAGERREPNFFEILKAGIVEGSLGQYNGFVQGDIQTLEKSKDLQIIKIGANIIDCADTDNYPTIIYFMPGGIGVESAGVENLPYLQGVDTDRQGATTWDKGKETRTKADALITPILFNPNTGGVVSAGGPSEISATILRGKVVSAGLGDVKGTLTADAGDFNPDFLKGQSFTIPSTQFPRFASRPNGALASSDSDPQRRKNLVPYYFYQDPVTWMDDTIAQQEFLSFRIFSWEINNTTLLPAPNVGGNTTADIKLDNFLLALQYQPPGGKTKKTYMTLGGYDDGTGLSPKTGGLAGFQIAFGKYNYLIDPRSPRLRLSQGWGWNSTGSTIDPIKMGLQFFIPFGWGWAGTYTVYGTQWPEGDKDHAGAIGVPRKDSWYTNMVDPDGIARPADGWLGTTANPYRNLSDQTPRPVILQRPYRSVAELGYVCRDNPWKTLSFFDETSGDGALLDLFSVSDTPTVSGGRTNANASPEIVLNAIFKGVGQDSLGTNPLAAPSALASAYHTYVLDDSGAPQSNLLSANLSKAPDFLSSLNGNTSVKLDPVKYRRESVIRALAGVAQAHTWNLLIDVVVQVGRYPSSASNLANFVVDGEKRYWLSLAIDRYTGKIIDRQLEPASD